MTDRTMTLTVAHLHALAARLHNRGQSRFSTNHDSERADLRVAARVIHNYTAEFSSPQSTITIPADESV